MRYLFIIVIAILACFSSCKKKDSIKANSWQLGGSVYNSIVVQRALDQDGYPYFSAANANNEVRFSFSSFPTKDGTYKVSSPGKRPGDGEVVLIVIEGNEIFYCSDLPGYSVKIFVRNGIITITMNEVTLSDYDNKIHKTFTCFLSEQ